MELNFDSTPIEQASYDALVVFAFDKDASGGPLASADAKTANAAAAGWIEELYQSGEFSGKLLDTAMLYRPAGLKARRLVVVGGGKPDGFGTAELRNAAAAVVRLLKPRGIASIALALETVSEATVAAAGEGALIGEYDPDLYKTERKEHRIERFAILGRGTAGDFGATLSRAAIVAAGQNFARALATEPANRMTPSVLAERARAMCGEAGLECEILDRARMEQLGMGAMLGVAQGSAEPPVLIIARYRPLEQRDGAAHLALVGKAVTFDSGGISIKPSDNMDKMKFDMCGGAAVLGAMQAIAALKPSIPVTALIPAVENMPGGRAQRPGDIVTTLSGKTVEVLNTDAEGRLILADAMAYAKQLGCTHLVDAATLTGAIVVALGHVNTGVFANDEELKNAVLAAARAEGEKMWPMPIDEEYGEQLKSPFADLPNIGTRWGGAITAAMFLKEFADPAPWVHLDIAGTAWLEETKPYMPKGPTGVGVRTFVRLATAWK